MEFVFEILLQFFGELLLQLLFEAAAELGVHGLKETFKKAKNPVVATMGFILWGAIAGGISLLIMPKSTIHNLLYRQINVIVTPLVAGVTMMLIGHARSRKGETLVRLDRFGYAFVFALTMAIIRYIWAK